MSKLNPNTAMNTMKTANNEHHQYGYAQDQQALIHRLSRIEGQVRAIKAMTERGEYCIDIVTQISATTSALKSVAQLMLNDHLEHCVHDAVHTGGEVADQKIQEVQKVVAKLMKA